MRVNVMGYCCLNNGLLIEMHGIKYCDRFLCNNILKFKVNGFRLFYAGGVLV